MHLAEAAHGERHGWDLLTFSTLLMTLKHTAPYSWSCQLVSSLRSR